MITETRSKTLEITVGGAIKTTIEKCDVDGLYERVTRLIDASPGCKRIILDLSALRFTNHNIVGLILQCRKDIEGKGKSFEIHNAYGQPAYILEIHGITYHNDIPGYRSRIERYS